MPIDCFNRFYFQRMCKQLGVVFGCSVIVSALSPILVSAQSVVPDGGTATSISLAPSGQITVGIAPADTVSISHNTYSSFSVPSTGVNLDNSSVNARTIVNEVTSANLTTINGPLTVIGPKADVIIANPNGITVNGGRFINTGNVALSTGILGRDASNLVTTTVNAGEISIGADGLSGTMEELALLSKRLRIAGPLSFDTPTSASHVNIVTGDSTLSFDRVRGGFGVDGTGILPWAIATNQGSGSTTAVIVDITNAGSISAGRISVTVTDQGAGVRFAGDQLASEGGFRLTSSGKLELSQSKITANGSVNVNVGEAELISSETNRAEISSLESGVVVDARSGSISLGQGRVAGRVVSSDNLASSGGVTLTATGDITSVQIDGRGAELVSDAGNIANPQNNSNVVLATGGVVSFDGLTARATDDFRLTTDGAISFLEVTSVVGGDFKAFSNSAVSFDASVVTAQSDIRLDGTELRFGADDINQLRTELKAVDGGFVAKSTTGDILNFGSLLQGKTTTTGEVDSLGGASIYSARTLLNRSLSVDRLAVVFGEVDNLHIETTGNVLNETGRLFSNGGISILSGGDVVNETSFTSDSIPFTVHSYKGRRFASSLFLKRRSTTSVHADYGDQAIVGEQSFILGVGDVAITAQNIRNIGADITGANVTLNAAGEFSNEARQVGQLRFTQRCRWFCKTSGSSNLRSVGGTVTASQALTLNAGAKASNLAGSLNGADGIAITAPLTEFAPVFSTSLIEQRVGLTGAFSGRRGYLSRQLSFGSLQSTGGNITINGDAKLGAANLFATGGVTITGSQIESSAPTVFEPFEQRPIGLLWNIF